MSDGSYMSRDMVGEIESLPSHFQHVPEPGPLMGDCYHREPSSIPRNDISENSRYDTRDHL